MNAPPSSSKPPVRGAALVGAALLLSPWVAGCPDDPPPASVDAGADTGAAEEDASSPPPRDAGPLDASLGPITEDPYKGPWVMRPTTTRVVVRWETRAELSPPTIDYERVDGTGASESATGTSTETEVQLTYGIGVRVIEQPDVPGTFYVNEVDVTGLEPATCYRYTIRGYDDAAGRFCTMHEPDDHATPITFYAIGDTSPFAMGTLRVIDAVPPSETEFSIHVGDIQYYSTIVESQQYWFTAMTPLLRANAFLPALGNHEDEIEHELEDIYDRLFATPGDEDDQTYWYHYASGGVHFLSVSTEHDLTLGSEQNDWIEETLTNAEATPGYRFTVLYMHRPIYCVGDYEPRAEQREAVEAIVRAHRIPLVLAGHMHAYERFVVPYDDGAPFQTTYVTTGGGGFRVSPAKLSENAAAHPEDAALRVASHNFIQAMQLEITHDDADGVDVIRGICGDDTGMERDAFEIRCTPAAGEGPRCAAH